MSTMPMFDPQGVLRDVPQEQAAAAVKAGGMPAVRFQAPDSTIRFVPANRTQEAAASGGQILPYEQQDVKHPGFWSTLLDDAKRLLPNPSSGENSEHWQSGRAGASSQLNDAQKQQSSAQDASRQKAGYSATYRNVAPIAQGLGVNVPGMEQSAAEGDASGVMGHATAVPAAMATTAGAARVLSPFAARLATSLEKPIYPGAPLPEAPPAEVLQAKGLAEGGGKPVVDPAAGLGQIPVRETAPLDATAENKPYAGESARGRTLGGIPKRVAAPVASSPVPEPAPAVQAMPSPAANLPAPYQPFARPSVVPSTQNIRENMGMVADAEAQPNRITPDSREDNAIAQEMNWDLEKHGWRAMSEARRAAIAGSSTGVTKGDLAQAAKNLTSGTPGGSATGTAVDDLTEILRKSLEKVKQKQSQQGQ